MSAFDRRAYLHIAGQLRELHGSGQETKLRGALQDNLNLLLSALDIVTGPESVALEPTMVGPWKAGTPRCQHVMEPKIFTPYQCGRPASGGDFCPSHYGLKT